MASAINYRVLKGNPCDTAIISKPEMSISVRSENTQNDRRMFSDFRAVLSLDPPAAAPAPAEGETPRKAAKGPKAAFSLTEETAGQFRYGDAYTGAELKAALAEAGGPGMKAPTIKAIEAWLLEQCLIAMEKLPTSGFYYVPTPAGVDAGLRSAERVSARGTPYAVLQYTPPVQRMIVEHFIVK